MIKTNRLANLVHSTMQKMLLLRRRHGSVNGGNNNGNENGNDATMTTREFIDDNSGNESSDGRDNHGSECPICYTTSICVPYRISPCGHVYCYACLRKAVGESVMYAIDVDNATFWCRVCSCKVVSSSRC